MPQYQPIKELRTRKVIGYEALIRGMGGLLPDEIFKAAEKHKITFELDFFCFTKIIETTPKNMVNLHINIMPHTLLLLSAAGILEEYYRPGLVLELVEAQSLGRTRDKTLVAIKMAREMGYKIAIDDISSGFDRLRLLAELEPEYVKIDRPLIANCHLNPTNRKMLHHITRLCQDLRAKVIAEGVESEEELLVLQNIGVLHGQGYYLGPPDYLIKDTERICILN